MQLEKGQKSVRMFAVIAAVCTGCVASPDPVPVTPLPRISSPMEAIYKDCTHLGSYGGTDYDDGAVDRWVRSKGGNSVYTFDFNGYLAAAKCNRLANPSLPEPRGEKRQVSGIFPPEALVRGCTVNNHFQSNDLLHIRDVVLSSGSTDMALYTTDRPGYYEVIGYRCPK